MAYEVHLDVFDGPFELLLQLIGAQQVDLYEVRLSDIVDGFVTEMRRLESVDLELATEFLIIASTLIELKCRRLLPGRDDIDLDEDLALFEARDYLLARLVECKTFSAAAAVLASLEQLAARSVARRSGPDERFDQVAPDLLAGVDAQMIVEIARQALTERPRPVVAIDHVHDDEVSVSATLDDLIGILPDKQRATFRELTARLATKAHVVACFLAILELYKQQLVDITQMETFGEMTIVWTASTETTVSIDAVDSYDVFDPQPAR